MSHPLHPLPSRLARLLVKQQDPTLAGKVEAWVNRHSEGRYPYLYLWLDDGDPANLVLRHNLGNQVCQIIESENLVKLEE